MPLILRSPFFLHQNPIASKFNQTKSSLRAQRSNPLSFAVSQIRAVFLFKKELKPSLLTAEIWADCFASLAMTTLFWAEIREKVEIYLIFGFYTEGSPFL
jgi:hypothetical protein